jgi:hypothetical protein
MFNAGSPTMSKLVDKTPRRHVRKRGDAARVVKRIAKNTSVTRDRLAFEVTSNRWCVETIMKAAERSGLLKEKSSRIAGRVSPALVEEAKRRTGIEADTDLIAFALANVALQDNFAQAFKDASGKVDADLKLGF